MARSVLLGICFASGAILGVLGTVLHGNIWMLGDVESGLVVPWGAAVALVILLLGQVWAGMTAGRLIEPMLMGATTFTVASVAYVWQGPDQLVVPYSQIAFETLPGPVIASVLWWLGSAAVTVVAMFLIKWILMMDATRARRAGAPVDR